MGNGRNKSDRGEEEGELTVRRRRGGNDVRN